MYIQYMLCPKQEFITEPAKPKMNPIFLIYTSYIDYTTLTEYLSAFLPSILPLILSKLPPMVQCSDRSHAGILDLKAACLGIKEGKT